MTSGELIKILADYCPDTPVEVTVVKVKDGKTGGIYTVYDDTDCVLHIRRVQRA